MNTHCTTCTNKYLFLLITVSLLYLVDGNWSNWGKWSDCSAKCGGGTRKRRRRCNNPKPKKGGKKCSGKNREVEKCNTFSCWGKWTLYFCLQKGRSGLAIGISFFFFFLTVSHLLNYPSQGWQNFWKKQHKVSNSFPGSLFVSISKGHCVTYILKRYSKWPLLKDCSIVF